MYRQVIVIAAAGALLAGCQPQGMTRQEVAAQQQALEGKVAAWATAFSNRQRDSLATFYEQTAELTMAWPDGDRTNSWDEEAEKQRAFFTEARQVNFVLQNPSTVLLSPTSAVTTFRHAMDVIVGEVNPERRYFPGQGTLVWVRADGKSPWLIRAGQVSATAQAQ